MTTHLPSKSWPSSKLYGFRPTPSMLLDCTRLSLCARLPDVTRLVGRGKHAAPPADWARLQDRGKLAAPPPECGKLGRGRLAACTGKLVSPRGKVAAPPADCARLML